MEFMASFVENVLVYTTVYTLASLGILLAGRTGIFNVAGEGIMLASASAGFLAAFLSGNYLVGFICGAAVGALFGLVLIFIHETFKVNQFILGICLVIFGSGLFGSVVQTGYRCAAIGSDCAGYPACSDSVFREHADTGWAVQ